MFRQEHLYAPIKICKMSYLLDFFKRLFRGAKQEPYKLPTQPPKPINEIPMQENKPVEPVGEVVKTPKLFVVPPPPKSSKYTVLKPHYQLLWDNMIMKPSVIGKVKTYADKINSNKEIYQRVNALIPGSQIPWQFIGVVHLLECNLSFSHHLHNGDPLKNRTVHIPPGRPVTGKPPFAFTTSAVDALTYMGLDKETDWSITRMLYRLEGYNGYGYSLYHNINTPYLWSGSNLYVKGKYEKDGKYDAKAVSSQVGAALVLKQLLSS